jgi:hypothetical protein
MAGRPAGSQSDPGIISARGPQFVSNAEDFNSAINTDRYCVRDLHDLDMLF